MQEVQLTSKALTIGQKQILKWLKNDGVSIVVTPSGKINLTKFGLQVKSIKPNGFEAIKPYLNEYKGVNNKIYTLK